MTIGRREMMAEERSETGRERVARLFRNQSQACADLGSPLYAHLLQLAAADVEAGGTVAEVVAGHEDDPGPSALALRLLGAVHRLVLQGRAPRLAAFYPSVCGTPADPDETFAALLDVLRHHGAEVRAGLSQPPQTNEVGRAAALVGGLLTLADQAPLPIRLHEIGASAGLNLRADFFRVETASGEGYGDQASPVRLVPGWESVVPGPPLTVVHRAGSDIAPVDPTTASGRLRLLSYVWPDQRERLDRLRGALTLAAEIPVVVRRARAVEVIRDLDLVDGTWTVVWHSVMWQYLGSDERTQIEALLDGRGRGATPTRRLAHLFFEPRRRAPEKEHEFLVMLRTWPGDDERILGSAPPHGMPVRWE